MSLFQRLVVFVLCLGPLGCLGALQKHNEQVRTERRGEGIAAACKAKDTTKLEEFLKAEPDAENRKAANTCLIDLRVASLTALDCAGFEGAFTAKDGGRRDPRVDFVRHLSAVGEPARAKVESTILDKAFTCDAGAVLFGDAASVLVTSGEQKWVAHYDRLAKKNDGEPLIDRLLAYLRDEDPPSTPSGARLVAWLRATKPSSRCADIEAATRKTKGTIRFGLLQFFVDAGCKTEATTIATEHLTSPSAGARMNACLAFGILKDRSRLAEMRRLAQTDTARTLDRERLGYFTYAYVTYPVREACQQTLNELEIAK